LRGNLRKIIAIERYVQRPDGNIYAVNPSHGLRNPLRQRHAPPHDTDQRQVLVPPLFSTISCARRCNVRSISGADINCVFSTMRMAG